MGPKKKPVSLGRQRRGRRVKRPLDSFVSKEGDSALDEQFEFERPYKIHAAGQKVQGSEFVVYEQVIDEGTTPSQLNLFINKCDKAWACNANFKFKLQGMFQYRTDDTDLVWKACGENERKIVVLAPNWFEMLIKEFTMFTSNDQITYKKEARHVGAHFNTFLYWIMNKKMKKIMCVYPAGPGHSVPDSLTDWDQTGEGWKRYSEDVFPKLPKDIVFDYVPWHTFPFFQKSNYFSDGEEQNVFPMHLLENLNITFLLSDYPANIFKKSGTDVQKKYIYRFKFTKLSLVTEQLRLESRMYNRIKGYLPYKGVYRYQQSDAIPAGSRQFKIKLQKITFPESLIIFALPKEVLSDNYSYEDNVGGYVFYPHNVTDTEFGFGDQRFFLRPPNVGNIGNEIIEHKNFVDYLLEPPLGLDMDPEKVTISTVCGKGTPYPHVYINLKNYGDKSRILPAAGDLSVVDSVHDLDITLTFSERNGSPDNVVFVTYATYTDSNISFNTTKRKFDKNYSPFV